jgi:hypothetical protein
MNHADGDTVLHTFSNDDVTNCSRSHCTATELTGITEDNAVDNELQMAAASKGNKSRWMNCLMLISKLSACYM